MKNKYGRYVNVASKYVLFVSVILLTMTVSMASASGLDALSIGGTTRWTVGNFATVYINAVGADDVKSLSLDILYDPTIIVANNVTIVNLSARGLLAQPIINNDTGDIFVGLTDNHGINGSGPLFKINYSVVGLGSSRLNISGASARDISGNETSINSTINSTFTGTANITESYDFDNNGKIDKGEAVQAAVDYFSEVITRQDAIDVVVRYFNNN